MLAAGWENGPAYGREGPPAAACADPSHGAWTQGGGCPQWMDGGEAASIG